MKGGRLDYRLADDGFQKKGVPVRLFNNAILSHHDGLSTSNEGLVVVLRLIVELQFLPDGLLEDIVVLYYVGLEHVVSLFFIAEEKVELIDEQIGVDDRLGGVDKVGHRRHLRPKQARTEANRNIIGIHLILLLPHNHVLLQEVNQERQGDEV